MTERPRPLPPKTDGVKRNINRYAYLDRQERAWLAGLVDGCGRIANDRIMMTGKAGRILTYSVRIRATKLAEPGIIRAGELLRITPRDYSSSGSGRLEIAIPHDCIDDFMAIIKPFISAGKYNIYTRVKYLSELSEFELGQPTSIYTPTGTKKMYKGINWKRVDALLDQPDITDALRRNIGVAIQRTQALVVESD